MRSPCSSYVDEVPGWEKHF